MTTDTNSGHRLRFVSSAAVLLHVHGKPMQVSVPALPWRGFWAVTQVSEYSITITHVISGMKIGDVSSRRAGRMACAVLNALPFDWSDWGKAVYEFRDSVWFRWVKELRS